MEMELISRETMKPSSPTPPHLETYPLSFMDVKTNPTYVPLVYFYRSNNHQLLETTIAILKKSLSEALSMYYPMAGRFRDQVAIHCNDQGVPLLITAIKRDLSHILNNTTHANLLPLFPQNLPWTAMQNPTHDPILAIQINTFSCGGIAIALCMSHKFSDISALFNFVNDWAAITKNYQNQDHSLTLPSPPLLHAGVSLFPLGDFPVYPEPQYPEIHNTVCKRFVFQGSRIDSLKAMTAPVHATRIQAVTALICKCAISALGLSPNTPLLSSVAVNLRNRIDPPIPSKTVGNMISFFTFSSSQTDQVPELVSKMKKGMADSEKEMKKYGGKNRDLDFIGEFMKEEEAEAEAPVDPVVIFSSWCRFSMYEADFGWEKPVWISSVSNVTNLVILMDARDGKGMEVVLSMEEEHMARIEGMEMELICKESMKPSSATPLNLKTYPLSFFDVTTTPQYMPILYFYHPKQIENQESMIALLKESLQEALSAYYPIAGRFKGQLAIDCNDEGVPLLITKLKCHLSNFLKNPITPNLLPLFPDNLAWSDMNNPEHDPIMAIQINCFQCAFCLSHKLGDVSTLINFVNHWAAIASHHQDQNKPLLSPPLLDAGVSIFPQGNLPAYGEKHYLAHPKTVCKRFVFEASKIEALKAMAGAIHPTRFQAVAALICKCAVSALGLSPNSELLTSVVVNLRKRMDPAVPSNTIGNMLSFFKIRSSERDQVPELLSKMKEGMIGSEMQWKKYGGKYRDLDFTAQALKREAESPASEALKFPVMGLTSWCRFSMYEADFGWGKEVWIASVMSIRNGVVFMDARDGKGMEVIVNMEEQHMARFECNEDSLQYASLDPPLQL
ncbi:hypothetical protein PIB30_041100 [Stylosanthes scabra]|uniref:Uncharacterized protein n=1 Tax=Stylosanthes scabra TaxID=79078 RepID=A0ABU6ZDI8_9FABA|nr:hypothetical protein [Stylosanthes scabra]